MFILNCLGNILIFCSVILVFIGIYGVLSNNLFYAKVLASSKIDTVAMITLLIGTILKVNNIWFALKIILVLLFIIFINPIITSKIILAGRNVEEMTVNKDEVLPILVGERKKKK